MKQNMGQEEANALAVGDQACYWLNVPLAGQTSWQQRGPFAITQIQRAESRLATGSLLDVDCAKPGRVVAVKLSDSPCWVRVEYLLSNIHQDGQ